MLKEAVSIPGISMTYVLNKALKMKGPNLYTPGQPCILSCGNCLRLCMRVQMNKSQLYAMCEKQAYELLKTGMVGGPSVIFCWYAEAGRSRIRTSVKTCTSVVAFNVNSLYLYCSGQRMPCGKEQYVKVECPKDPEELCNKVMKGELFWFLQVDIHVPDYLRKGSVNSAPCLLWIPFWKKRSPDT